MDVRKNKLTLGSFSSTKYSALRKGHAYLHYAKGEHEETSVIVTHKHCSCSRQKCAKSKLLQSAQKLEWWIAYDIRVGLILSIQILNSKLRIFIIFVST